MLPWPVFSPTIAALGEQPPMANVFLSYDREDVHRAQPLAAALEQAGHTVWWDRRITPGAEFSKAIEEALASSDIVLVLWSARAVKSHWVRDEAAIGRDTGRLVPASLDGCAPPLGFRQFQTIDLSGSTRAATNIMTLLGAIDGLTDSGGAPSAAATATPSARGPDRRMLVAGLAAAAALGGGGLWAVLHRQPATPAGVEPLLAQAWQAWTQGSSAGYSQAIGLYIRATQLAPDHADAWGLLGCIYGDEAHGAPASEQADLRARAQEAGRRALQLDPKNAFGRMAVAYARPLRGNRLLMEREFRQAMRDQPGRALVTYSLALSLTRVGRLGEAAALFDQLRGAAPTASQYKWHIRSLWGCGRLGEADRLLQEASTIYALNGSIWTTRFDMLMTSGRPAAAAALARDVQGRPDTLTEDWMSRRVAVANAVGSRTRTDIDAVRMQLVGDARQSASAAVQAIQDLAMLGCIDEAFGVADAFFFSRDFAIPDKPGAIGADAVPTLASRETMFLFLPPARLLRADSRFDRLVEAIGLTRYWREAGVQPDYRSA